ncbi:4-hydroxythreonine-4-phosphate dehydrogenase PdxA [bacterium]|nr:4-hydroxythreonine-4-phosphate dehydrogenase PdxA [bacterium]
MKKIAITCGDVNGIGAEIVFKALQNLKHNFQFVLVGPPKVWNFYSEKLNFTQGFEIFWESENNYFPEFGKVSAKSGEISGKAIELATKLALSKQVSAIVTAPINKEALNLAGYKFKGHTDFLEKLCNIPKAVMFFCAKDFRVALQTIHVPIAKVPELVTQKSIVETVKICVVSLKNNFRISNPKIAVCGLNPHAGENGLLGNEELTEIIPAIEKLQKEGFEVHGTFPADTIFTSYKKFDLILAMFHDQGLIPIKTKMFGKVVNFTAGLPFIRTSPDHGTAFDLAGKFVANSKSMEESIKLAVSLI